MLTWGQLERGMCGLLGTVHTSLGMAILIGGVERFPPPSYEPLLLFSNERSWPYGVFWLAGGLLMFLPPLNLRLLGTALSFLVSCLWMGLFLTATIWYTTAALTPVAAYGGFALFNAVLFALMWIHRGRENEGT